MNKDFNVYKWRREHLTEIVVGVQNKTPDELFAAFKEEFNIGSHRDDLKVIKTLSRYSPPEAKVKELFDKYGYTLTVSKIDAEPGERGAETWFYYKKK
jgi:hypothetical protein